MDWDRVEEVEAGQGKVKRKWGQLTDGDLDVIDGRGISSKAD